MKEIYIDNVEIVNGNELKSNWKSSMYVITDNKGNKYIDNVNNIASAKWNPTNWMNKIGKTVKINVVKNKGYNWSKFIEDSEPTFEELFAIKENNEVTGIDIYNNLSCYDDDRPVYLSDGVYVSSDGRFYEN